jgi:hypothetical protein
MRSRPRVHLALPVDFVQALGAEAIGPHVDNLVAKVQVDDLQAPAMAAVNTTVATETRATLKRVASILGTKEGVVVWLLQELGPLQVQMLCRKRGAPMPRRSTRSHGTKKPLPP